MHRNVIEEHNYAREGEREGDASAQKRARSTGEAARWGAHSLSLAVWCHFCSCVVRAACLFVRVYYVCCVDYYGHTTKQQKQRSSQNTLLGSWERCCGVVLGVCVCVRVRSTCVRACPVCVCAGVSLRNCESGQLQQLQLNIGERETLSNLCRVFVLLDLD